MNKHINSFDTVADFNGYISSDKAFFPNVAHVSGETRARIIAEAPESPYEMRFFDSHGDQIDTERYTFELDIVYTLRLYDKDNEDYVATASNDGWTPEITTESGTVEIEEDSRYNQYSFIVRWGGVEPDVNFKAIVDRQTVDEANYHFIAGM